MRHTILSIFSFLFIGLGGLQAQQTVGLFVNDSLAYDGYTLMAPNASKTTFLLDNCGDVVNKWVSNYSPALSAYLLPNGDLLRTAQIPNPTFSGGGSGGRLERFDWDGNLVWEYEYSSATVYQHHDIEPMPNGNILILAWEYKSRAEAVQAGRDTAAVPALGIWSEHVVEIKPIGTDSATIVWEWHIWDHLVQEFNANRDNFGVVKANPQLINLNYYKVFNNGNVSPDWMHANSVDYNPELDQIIINSRDFEEFWIIDHSTTTAEAASHSGGNSGKGGDILYRWGNPRTYDLGDSSDQKFYSQHDARWVPKGLPHEGKILVFNNGTNRPTAFYSSVEMIDPPVDNNGNYTSTVGIPFGPDTVFWNYTAPNPTDFYSSNVSGMQMLPNGNILICEGAPGNLFEVDSAGTILWQYICPENFNGPIAQGGSPLGNGVFRVDRYSRLDSAFIGKTFGSLGPIELNPLPSACQIYPEDTSIVIPIDTTDTTDTIIGLVPISFPEPAISVYPNPVNDVLQVSSAAGMQTQLRIYNLQGVLIHTGDILNEKHSVSTANWARGVYIVAVKAQANDFLNYVKILKE